MSLEGKKVLVVGGSSGIGLATAQLAKKAGATVMIGGRDPDKLDAAGKIFDDSAQTVVLDVTSDDSVAAACKAVGPVDHVVVTPPGAAVGPLRELDIATAQAALNVKFWDAVRVAKYANINVTGTVIEVDGGAQALLQSLPAPPAASARRTQTIAASVACAGGNFCRLGSRYFHSIRSDPAGFAGACRRVDYGMHLA